MAAAPRGEPRGNAGGTHLIWMVEQRKLAMQSSAIKCNQHALTLSGWWSSASLRCADLILASVASRGTPRTSAASYDGSRKAAWISSQISYLDPGVAGDQVQSSALKRNQHAITPGLVP